MRRRLAALLWSCLLLAWLSACKERAPEASPLGSSEPALPAASLMASDAERARPISSAVVAFEKQVQAQKLLPPARRDHVPQLAFGKGAIARLTRDAFLVYDTSDFRLLATEPLESPRALLALADGSLLAIGSQVMLRWERDKKRARALPKPVLLPGVDLYPDAQQPDVLWAFDGGSRGGAGARPATLCSYRSKPDGGPLLLPEQSIELSAPSGGVFGVTREGVWLYATPGHVERFGPGGLRLPGLTSSERSLPTWILPARRLDQSLWLDERGQVSRALVSPAYKQLARAQLGGPTLDVAVGDEGRLLAVVLVTGPGPRFELSLLDQELAPLGRVLLPLDAPTGADDWVKAVTENQALAVAPREALVAVGGPERMTIFDAHGKQLFSIPSR